MFALLLELQKNSDSANADFLAKLIPGFPREKILGVRSPILKKLAKAYAGTCEADAFLSALPHMYLDENNLHAAFLCLEKDPEKALERLEEFLPCVDNWATCDGINPKAFQKSPAVLLPRIPAYLSSSHVYTVRFGIGALMRYYLDDLFDPSYPQAVSAVRREEYYIRMMVAWYFATGLAKQYDAFVPYLTSGKLPVWTHNKTIQKAVESFRISPETKAYLKTLRRKENDGTV